jgi:hypothetical protein
MLSSWRVGSTHSAPLSPLSQPHGRHSVYIHTYTVLRVLVACRLQFGCFGGPIRAGGDTSEARAARRDWLVKHAQRRWNRVVRNHKLSVRIDPSHAGTTGGASGFHILRAKVRRWMTMINSRSVHIAVRHRPPYPASIFVSTILQKFQLGH